MGCAVGIDIGGSHIEGIAVSRDLRITGRCLVPIKGKVSKEEFLEELFLCAEKLCRRKKLKGIGIGVPGIVHDGIVLKSPNIPFLESTNLKGKMMKKFRTKVLVDNDVKCMAFGEMAKRKEKDILVLTLGTGVGGGIVVDGKLYRGKLFAGEIGHMTIKFDGYRCSCGNLGCFEEYASARGVRKISWRVFRKGLEPVEIFRLAQKRNKKALAVWQEYGKVLGIGLSNLCFILNPEVIVLGGGISKAYRYFGKAMKTEMERRLFIPMPRIAPGMPHGNAFGAACMVLKCR